jgi:hypothetical protein
MSKHDSNGSQGVRITGLGQARSFIWSWYQCPISKEEEDRRIGGIQTCVQF